MTSIEYLISKMPVNIQRYYDEQCYGCGKISRKMLTFELRIDISQYEVSPNVVKPRYKMYYRAGDKVIGCSTGLGFLTLKEALQDLLTYKKDIRGEECKR